MWAGRPFPCFEIKMNMSHLIFPFLFSFFSQLGPAEPPAQPKTGPGGSEYVCDSIWFQDFSKKQDGYWLFEPMGPKPDSANLIVFIHGYGGYNPMIYGQWIRHLVRKGNIVVYPRYQKNIFWPRPKKFSENVSQAIRDALAEMENDGHVKPVTSNMAMVGHSYGGGVSGQFAINFLEHNIPKPKVVMLCAPGTGKLKGGRLESYADMPGDISLLIVTHENDWVVGDEFAQKVFKEATSVEKRNLLHHRPDDHGLPAFRADHNQSYSLDLAFDNGARNYTSKKALRVSTLDAVDFNGYWKLFDAMLDCNRTGANCETAFGGTPAQLSLGQWSDGTPVRPFEVQLPE